MPSLPTEIDAGRERLVALAMAMVEERGGQGLTMPELALRAGIPAAHIARYFATREDLLEAIAEAWFRPKVAAMEDVVASDLPPRRKMYEFFARRFRMACESLRADPVTFRLYMQLGEEHFEQVRSYIDLADHYLGTIIAEAMDEGHFAGLDIDTSISLVNQMLMPYCNFNILEMIIDKVSEEKLARIVDAVFDGLSGQDRGAAGVTGLRAA